MSTKKFISPQGWFSIQYPSNWYEFEDAEESFLFYNPAKWEGNLRISAFKDKSQHYADQIMQSELKNGAKLQQIGTWKCAVLKESFQEEGNSYDSVIYVTGGGNLSVEVSFTVAKGGSVKTAEEVIKTLVVRDDRKRYPKEIIPVRVWEIHQINEAFEWVQKAVKKLLKKDFTGSKEDLKKLQQVIDGGVYKDGQRETWEAVGIAFGVILYNEMDGMEWVTVIDGHREYPAMQFAEAEYYLEPMLLIWEKKRLGIPCIIESEFDRIKKEIEAKL